MLCHGQQARVGFVLRVGAALAAITVFSRLKPLLQSCGFVGWVEQRETHHLLN